MTLTDADGAADSADRTGVTELMTGEAQRVKGRYLGFGFPLRPGEPECPPSESLRRGGVDFDHLERGFG